MFDIEFDVSDIERAWRDDGIPALNAGLALAVRAACAEGAREAVNKRHYEDRTAHLTASIHGDENLQITADGAEGQITAGEDYASYVRQWEENKFGDDFMTHAETRAREVLTEGIDDAANLSQHRMNGR